MMITTGNHFLNFPASGFFIILQNANMVANGKVNCVMSPFTSTPGKHLALHLATVIGSNNSSDHHQVAGYIAYSAS